MVDLDMAYPISRPRHLTIDWAAWFESLFEQRRPKPQERIDPRALSDHLKRDLGLIDGRNPIAPHR